MIDEILKRWKKLKHKKELVFKLFNKEDDFANVVRGYFEKLSTNSSKFAKLEELEREDVNIERRLRLLETDWTQLADAPLTPKERIECREYRQYIRDLPELWKNKQILEYRVMSFDEWRDNPPVYDKKRKIKV